MKGFIIGALKVVAYIIYFLFPIGYAVAGYTGGLEVGGEAGAIGLAIAGLIGGFLLGTLLIGGLFVLIDIRDEMKALRKALPEALTTSKF
jgi:hypothetical protein